MQKLRYLPLILTLVLISSTHAQEMHGGHGDAGMSPLAGLAGEAFETGFMSMMIAHHQGAIAMSEWILEHSERPEVRETAEAIIASQEEEILTMREWLQDWYGQEPDADMVEMMRAEDEGMMQEMMAHEDTEVGFLTAMTEHHDGAIDMAQLALTRAVHGELRALARDIIVEQAEEIYRFQEWLSEMSAGETTAPKRSLMSQR
ncbi:MAG: DUF305 domain-containing protein [Deinococcota bacterium]|nr:DUF305 domain-containing protein [Deinococcota bacterium]